MAKAMRRINQSIMQSWDALLGATRVGKLSQRMVDTVVRGMLYRVSGAAAVIVEGLIIKTQSGLIMEIDSNYPTAVIAQKDDPDVGDDVEYALYDMTGNTVTLDTADPTNARIDIIEARIATQTAFTDDVKQRVSPTSFSVIAVSHDRDTETIIELRKVTGTPAGSPVPPASTGKGTQANITASATIGATIDCSTRKYIYWSVGRDAEFVRTDISGATPSATTQAEIISAMNAAGFGSIFSIAADTPSITTAEYGPEAIIRFKMYETDPNSDAVGILFGDQTDMVSGGIPIWGYYKEYIGDRGWFKIAEITVPALAATPSSVLDRNSKASWAADSGIIVNGFSLEDHRTAVPIDHPDDSVFLNHLAPEVHDFISGATNLVINQNADMNGDNISTEASAGFTFGRFIGANVQRGDGSFYITLDDPVGGEAVFSLLDEERQDRNGPITLGFDLDDQTAGESYVTGPGNLRPLIADTDIGPTDYTASPNYLPSGITRYNGTVSAGGDDATYQLQIGVPSADVPIKVGDSYTVDNAGTPNWYSGNHQGIAALSNTEIVAVYEGAAATDDVYAQLITRDKLSHTVSDTEQIIASGLVSGPVVAALSATKFVVVWSTTTAVRASVCTVSGGIISAGAATDLATATNAIIGGIASLTDTLVVVTYVNNNPDQFAVAATISGSSITPGTAATLDVDGNTTKAGSVCALDADKFLAVYHDGSGDTWAHAGTVSGTTITAGTPLEINAGGAVPRTDIVCAQIDTDIAVTAHAVGTEILIRTFSAVGTTLTQEDTDALAADANTEGVGISCPSIRRIALVYRQSIDAATLQYISWTHDGTGNSLTAGEKQKIASWNSTAVAQTQLCACPNGAMIAGYKQGNTDALYLRGVYGSRFGTVYIDRVHTGAEVQGISPDAKQLMQDVIDASQAKYKIENAFGFTGHGVSSAQNNLWKAIVYGNGLFVAVATSGTNRVMTSPDGITWTAQSAAEANTWQEIIYGGGQFMAVASDGVHRVMTSPDGITWTAQDQAENNAWTSIAYGGGTYVAVSFDGTNRVMTSPDGITWTARSAAEANQWEGVTYGNGLFVAVASSGTNHVMTSPDGITWTARSAAEANQWKDVTYGNGLFVAVAGTGTNRVMTSPDGITWTARSAAEANQWWSVFYGNGLFVALSADGTNQSMTSPDGITWTSSPINPVGWYGLAHGNGLFVAVSPTTSADQVAWSYDGDPLHDLRITRYLPDGSSDTLIKQFDAEWSEGDAAGAMQVGSYLPTAGYYWVSLIDKMVDGVVQWDVIGHLRKSDVAAPDGWALAKPRPIWAQLTDSSANNRPQYHDADAGIVLLTENLSLDLSVADQSTTRIWRTAINAPPNVTALTRVYVAGPAATRYARIESTAAVERGFTVPTAPLYTSLGTSIKVGISEMALILDNNRQYTTDSDGASTTVRIQIFGWLWNG